MLALLIGGWSVGRVVWWENPFATVALAQQGLVVIAPVRPAAIMIANGTSRDAAPTVRRQGTAPGRGGMTALLQMADVRSRRSRVAGRLAGVQAEGGGAMGDLSGPAFSSASARAQASAPDPAQVSPPFLPMPPPRSAGAAPGRWSLDAWAFWRQGSNAAPVSQGRVPIYGASQAGAVLQFRLVPSDRRDLRLYARAYRALVQGGESELALGTSLRPVPAVPLRLAGEVRYTDTPFGTSLRPAAYVVTEIAPVPLPHGARLEAYGQAGWVGGAGRTAFADGQASITAALPQITRVTDNTLRVSLGAAAWGGAQRDAQRLDIGPTLRFDMAIGAVPARVSVDWRERIAGQAAPYSGLTATLSTSF
ncbi:hypothetical protein [Porphyrobacter sp. TH134]|uniref:hypothetical protein n=1 Tax=Porphyrobacter sp. TH134 TaxID=2067450 RepID=UPI00117FB8B8|nr:hypothetical protein [Porphyrobacter sp. TH134]